MRRPTPACPLFVPADRQDRIARACAAGTDGVIVDLEDAVAPARKEAARALPPDLPADRGGVALLLRINAAGTPWHEGDLAFAAAAGFDGVVLPKAETADGVEAVRARLPERCAVVALVETARGLEGAEAVARAADRVAFGSVDFAEDLGCAQTSRALLHARARLVMAARLAGGPPPLDGVTLAARDADAVAADAADAAELGFGGKLLIHPAQVAPARAAFRPDAAQVDWARRVMALDGTGAAMVDGAMVDAPVLARARRILASAGR